MNKTYSAKPKDIQRQWYLIDASDDSLGRIAVKIANLLTGKDKPMKTAHIDCGDYVVVINTDMLKVTGNKLETITYYRHSLYAGGLHSRSLKEQIEKDSTKAIYNAVKGMLPDNKLREDRLNRLKIYPKAEHNHQAQQPTTISLKRGVNK